MKAVLDDSSFGPTAEGDAWITRALNGDPESATRLYAHCVPRLQAWLRMRVTGCEAEDLAHETMLIAFRRGSSFRSGGPFMAWLKTIAWNLAQKRLRGDSRRRRREHDYMEHETRIGTGGPDGTSRRLAALHACLASLPEPQRRLVHLRYFEGRSSSAIAATHGRSRGAVAVSLHRICQGMRAEMQRTLQPYAG